MVVEVEDLMVGLEVFDVVQYGLMYPKLVEYDACEVGG